MKLYCFLFFLCSINYSKAQELNTYTFKEVEQLQENEKRNVIIFVSTSWCKYCKITEKTILKDKEVISKLNNDYYFIILEADKKDRIEFKNKIYNFKPSGINLGYNEIIEVLFEKKTIAFPSFIEYNEDWEFQKIIQTTLSKTDFLSLF